MRRIETKPGETEKPVRRIPGISDAAEREAERRIVGRPRPSDEAPPRPANDTTVRAA
jgi:hypothetical protein